MGTCYVYIPLKRRDHHFNNVYFISTRDITTRPYCPWALRCKKTLVSLLLWNSVHPFELLPSLIPLWAYRKAQVRCIPGDAKSRHQKDKQHLFTLKNSSRAAAMVEISHMQAHEKAVRCLYHTVIPNLNRVLERIPIKFALLKLSGHPWQG